MAAILITTVLMLLAGYAVWTYCLSTKTGLGEKQDNNAMFILITTAAAVLIKIILSTVYKGHETDMNCFIGWANAAFEHGLGQFYNLEMFHDYPPGYMYVLYCIGALQKLFSFTDGAQLILFKLPAVLCDIGAGIILYKMAHKRFSSGVSALIGALYMLNPAVIVNSSLWGQVDAVYTLLILLMVYMLAENKMLISYFVFALCIFIKPQAFIFTPLLILAVIENVFLKDFSCEKFFKNLGCGLCAVLFMFLLALPFGISNVFEQYKSTLASYPYMTVNAMNLWAALGKNWEGLTTLTTVIGYIFLAAIVAYSVFVFLKGSDKSKYYFTGAMLAFMTFMLSTKMHERYAFPAMVLLLAAFIVSLNPKHYLMYILLSASQFFNTAWVLFVYSQDSGKYFRSAPVTIASIINLALLMYIIYVSVKKEAAVKPKPVQIKHEENKSTQTKKVFSPEVSAVFKKISRFDVIAMAVITLIYSAVALYDLGDMHAPQSYYMLSNGQSAVIDLGQDTEVTKCKFYLGPRELNDSRTLDITASNSSGREVYSTSLTSGSVFKWEECTPAAENVRYVTLSTKSNDLYLMEFAAIDVLGRVITPADILPRSAKTLIDEAKEVPDRSTFRNGTYFDEIYHGRTGYEFVHSMSVYEWTHPPLGKVFIALGIKLFGMCPFGWRIAGTVFGILMVPIIYLFALRLLKKSWLAVITCLLFTFDFMHFAQTRIATIDVYGTFFIMLMYYFMYKYYSSSFYDHSFKKGLSYLALCGVCMGLGIASKWTGIYAGIGLAVLFFITLGKRYYEYLQAVKTPDGESGGISHRYIISTFKPYMVKTVIWCCVFFILVPALIYCLSYIPYLQAPDAHGFKSIIDNQSSMYTYHAKTVLGSEHPYSSRWYEWIIMKRPIWYYSGTVSEGVKEGISAFGNPLVWWLGIPAFFYMVYLTIKKRDKNAMFLVIAYLAQLVSWIPITRLTFIYHYFPCVPFIVLMLGYSVMTIYNEAKNKKAVFWGAVAYAALVIILFAMFYPVLSGHACSVKYAENFLKWFDSWVLL